MMHIAATCMATAAMAAPWRTYEVYRPTVERHFVVDAHTQKLKYNHVSSVAWFEDRWFCVWNANEPPREGDPGQLNVVSTSRDGKRWSPPRPAFASDECSTNPVPCPTGMQWQPSLIVVDGELWAFWDQNSKDEHAGCYFSKLDTPDGKWLNRRLLWDGEPRPVVDGKPWRLFPTQNPYRLRSGRVLVPVTMIGSKADDVPDNVTAWWASEKRNSVIYTDDGGKTWSVSPGAMQPRRSWAQWEPTVWEEPDGTVMMFARNNDPRTRDAGGPKPSQMLLWSKSTDRGATWTPHKYVPLQTVASRMHVMPIGGDRFMMVHNDWPAGRFAADRNNLALFFTRGGGIDFVAGTGLTDVEPVVAYPQMWIRDNGALISYTQARGYRSIKVVHVSPLPDPSRYYLFPRSNQPVSPRPKRVGDALRFSGRQHVATRRIVDPGKDGFAIGAWVRPRSGGALLDTRSTAPAGGFIWGLSRDDLKPFIYVHTPEGNIASNLHLRRNEWNYVGVTVDNRTGIIWFFVDGQRHGITYRAPAPRPLRGTTGHIGAKRFASSSVAGFQGDVRALAVYATPSFAAQEHAWLHNRFADRLSRPTRAEATAPKVKPIVWFDPADAASFEAGFELPGPPRDPVAVEVVDGRKVLRMSGEASAGVDLDANRRDRGDRIDFTFRFKILTGHKHVLCTIGDADRPARVLVLDDTVFLTTGDRPVRCGAFDRNGWTGISLISGGNQTVVKMAGGQIAAINHRPVANWLYMGQGYLTGTLPVDHQFLVDVGSVRSCVVRPDRR